ncbi:MAG TPA: glucose 1-dehydrogenase [Thermomicrobiales bacterium]|jgi:NAD(P)-dependent dehydrogenase (short-subunit alcohol dehydrogenase family)
MPNAYLDDLFSLDGRVALVTGASSGIGRELATGLALAGATVAISGRSVERLEETKHQIVAAGGKAEAFPAEAGDFDAIKPLIDAVVARFGRLDIVLPAAGMNQRQPVREVERATYDRLMEVNLRAPYFLAQAALPHLIAAGGGKVIHIGSLTTSWGIGNLSVYGMTKSAIGQLTRASAVEWAAHNIQVNAICPGWIETPLTKPLWADPQRRTWILDRVPAGRPGKPGDLVGMAVYLASRASDFTTGQTFYVDGGFTAGGQW